MRSWKVLLIAFAAAGAMMLAGCGSNRDSDNETATFAPSSSDPDALFVGSETCEGCHAGIYGDFTDSGHPYKLNKVVDNQIPTYPFSTINGALEQITDEDGETDNSLGTPNSYADISYVIGGYGWKARWVDADGYIVTGSSVQYNLEDGSMAGYHDDEVDKPYNCGNCHTTGWRHYDASLNSNRQDNLPGMDGTFVAGGVQCESCHGAGAAHVASQDKSDIVRLAEPRTTSELLSGDMGYSKAVACSECHTRDGEKDYPTYVSAYNQDFPEGAKNGGRIVAKGGLIKHHEQYDEMVGIDPATGDPLGKHLAAGVSCVTCHDPHKTVKQQDAAGESGLRANCTDCHGAGKQFEVAMPSDSYMGDFDCTSCHMPDLAKSAVKHAAVGTGPITGDIATHIFKINLEGEQFTDDGKFSNPWITKDWACGTCHNGEDTFDVSGVDLADYKFHQSQRWTPSTDAEIARVEGEYAGSASCNGCHTDQALYDDFIQSGHPYKLNKVVDNQVPTYPFSDLDPNNDGGLLPNPEDGVFNNEGGEPTSYADITYVIGGYGWKARWVGSEGYVVTSDRNQYNLEDGSWGNYHADDVNKPYNCGNCHTTGWKHYDETDNPNRQDGLAGMDGTFAEGGIHCESCHGGAMLHVLTQNTADVTKIAEARTTADFEAADMGHGLPVACGECHTRDGEKDYPSYLSGANNAGYTGDQGGRIVAKGGLAKHHEQYDEMLGLDINDDGSLVTDINGDAITLGKHLNAGVTCVTCHDPHTTTKYQDDPANTSSGPGVRKDCTTCHSMSFTATGTTHASTDCITCHMPKLAKSAIKTGPNAAGVDLGDIKSHIFKIDLSQAEQLTSDGKWVYPRLTPDYACGTCHSDTAAKVGNLNNSYGGKIHQ